MNNKKEEVSDGMALFLMLCIAFGIGIIFGMLIGAHGIKSGIQKGSYIKDGYLFEGIPTCTGAMHGGFFKCSGTYNANCTTIVNDSGVVCVNKENKQ